MIVEIANFVCTYDSKPLLDEFERFYRAIYKSKEIVWKRGETKGYKFIHVKLVKIRGEAYLIGRLVKKITHVSSQILRDEEDVLDKSVNRLRDHPSSAFMLRLYDHKIIIVKETKKAPVTSDFKHALRVLLKNADQEIFNKELMKYKKKLNKVRLSSEESSDFELWFHANYPRSNLSITPIGTGDVKAVFKNVKSINKYVLRIPHSNDENPRVTNSFMKSLTKQRKLAGTDKSTSSELVFKDTEVGLNQAYIKDITENAGKSGGTFGFHMTGKTIDNEKLDVSETDVKVTYTIPTGADLDMTAQRATKRFKDLVASGTIKLPELVNEEEMIAKASEVYNNLTNDT